MLGSFITNILAIVLHFILYEKIILKEHMDSSDLENLHKLSPDEREKVGRKMDFKLLYLPF